MIDRWFEAFGDQPEKAVADLFSGRAGLSSDLRLDVPELLYQTFPPNLADDRAQLDKALLSWLRNMRQDYPPQVNLLGFPVYAKRICDALIALQLLDLPEARHRIRADLDAWLGWLSPLRLAPERDPALECLRLLTLGQPDAGHTAMWFRLAADPRSEYLTVALEGLRLLPNQDDARTNQMLMLQALLRHAITIRHETSTTFFLRRFAALRGLFPRAPQHWKQVLGEAWIGFREHTQEEATIELGEAIGSKWLDDPPAHTQASVPVPQERWEHLRGDILSQHQSETLAGRLFDLLEQNHNYATATGVSHFFVRTLHNLGTLLLRQHQLGPTEMRQFGLMIERALVWEPTNPYCWMLWAEWFQVGALPDAHEATLREMLRLFPNSVHARVELSRLLIERGEDHWDEARHWLHQAMKRDPDSGHSQVLLDRLSHRQAEFVQSHPDDPIAQQSLNQLPGGTHTAPSANPLGESKEDSPQEVVNQGGQLIFLSFTTRELIRRGSLGREFSRARVAKVLGHVVSTYFLREETRRGDPLAGFYSQWLIPEETPECPPHAWAWKACRHWQESASSDTWLQLAKQFPEASTETHFLRILAESPSENRPSRVGDWHTYCSSGVDTGSPGVAFMREALERIDETNPHERDEDAVQVMAHRAADALEFVSEPVA